MSGVASAISVGAKNWPGRSARRAPPVTMRPPRATRVGDVLLRPFDLRGEGDGADVDVAGVRLAERRRPLAQLRDLGGRQLDEAIGDRVLDDHPFGADADLAAVREAAPDGGVRGAPQVGVGQHDHRRLAAQLQHGRDQAHGGGLRPPACRSRRCR